jgi:hypothetical protein
MFDDPAEVHGARAILQSRLGHEILDSPLIRGLHGQKPQPSYIGAETFANAVIAVSTKAGGRPPLVVEDIMRAAGITLADRDKLRDEIMAWYDAAMDRLSGDYKRRSKTYLFVAGLMLAVTFNIDLLNITRSIWQNRFELDTVVAAIDAYHADVAEAAKATGKTPGEFLEELRELSVKAANEGPDALSAEEKALLDENRALLDARPQQIITDAEVLDAQSLPVGWKLGDEDCAVETTAAAEGSEPPGCTFRDQLVALWDRVTTFRNWKAMQIIGWILTALAILPGTKFWFDILGQALALRSSGPKPQPKATPTQPGQE